MLNVNSYNVKYRVFVCVAHKLIPFHKTRRSQSPPGARPHAGTSSHGSGQRPIRCPFHTTAASPCLALPCNAMPCHATPRHAMPCRAPPSPAMDASASFPPAHDVGGGIRKLLSRVLLRACLGTHVAAQSPFRAFARPAVPSRPVFTSPVSRASFELSGRPLAPPTVSLRPSCRPNQLPSHGAFRLLSGVCRACSPSPGVVKICFHIESK